MKRTFDHLRSAGLERIHGKALEGQRLLFALPPPEIEHLIRAGLIPARRNTKYEFLSA